MTESRTIYSVEDATFIKDPVEKMVAIALIPYIRQCSLTLIHEPGPITSFYNTSYSRHSTEPDFLVVDRDGEIVVILEVTKGSCDSNHKRRQNNSIRKAKLEKKYIQRRVHEETLADFLQEVLRFFPPMAWVQVR